MKPPGSTTTGEALVRALAAHGVRTVLGIPGTHNLGLFAPLATHGIEVVVPRHEQGGGYAADAYARVSGRPGVLVTTTGPGVLNAATSIAQAWSDSSPVLVVAPGLPTTHVAGRASGYLHEMRDQFAAMAAVVDDARRVESPAQAAAAVRDAFAAFGSSRPRPRYLEVPLDLVDATGPVTDEMFLPADAAAPEPAEADLVAAAAVLAGAARPGIVAGGGAARAGEQVRAVAEALGAPVATTTNGRGVLPEDHRLALGAALHLAPVQEWLRSCDAVLVVGSELAESDAWTTAPLVRGQVVRVDLDPAQDGLAAPAGTLLVGDAAPTLAGLLARLPASGLPESGVTSRWGEIDALRAATRSAAAASAERWAPLLAGLRAALPADAVLATDNAMAAYRGALVGLPMGLPSSYLFPTGFGTLGFAVPAAVGAALAAPGRAVAALTGDGGLQFTLNELATLADVCRQQGRGVPVVVVTNGGYGEIKAQQLDRGDTPLGVDLSAPDWVRLAEAFGGRGVALDSRSGDPACAAEVAQVVSTALDEPWPTLVVVRESPDPPAPPEEPVP